MQQSSARRRRMPGNGPDQDDVRSPDVDPVPSATATALAPMVEAWRALLAVHVPDTEGRCSACRWQTRSADRWPCNVYLVAAAAERVASMGPTPGR
jgi:hypothetical protein